ncbi:nuclear fragile X mental retardation-interacting protein 1-domain-containing protein [Aspergillus ambiguus]|uniref:CCCH zinc finger protein n=1 Tax=Aspergillus ambiguus TaxID=176160 RepID=UPI003CCCD4E8
MRWGFEHGNPGGSFAGAHPRAPGPGPRPFNAYGGAPPGAVMPHAPANNKRDHKAAFGKLQPAGPRVPAPPAVPSFGNPLPSKPPPPADATRKPKKKKRKHNQLGLTPKTDEHESSEEEEDVDEESKFAQGGPGGTALQITYRGRTSTLQSAEDIAAWIEERKKRFPTQARIEERKKAMEEAKKAREEAARQKEQRRQEMKRAQKDQARDAANPMDEAAKAKQKADKLRRKLQKEQKRVEKAEADAERARMKVEELQKATSSQGTPSGNEPETVPGSESQTDAAQVESSHQEALDDDAGFSPNAESSDWTSSSGSDSSAESDDSDEDSAPEEATSRREGPERVAPPAREAKKRVCRHFARTGRCLRGVSCKFLHERPERSVKAKAEKPGRKGLLQALLGRQKEDEDRRAMEVIVWLGENGLLKSEEDTETGQPQPDATVNSGS